MNKKIFFIWCILVLFLYNTHTLSYFTNNGIILLILGLQITLIYFSWHCFTIGCFTNILFLIYIPFLLSSDVLIINNNTAHRILYLIIYIFIITIINFFILASNIRDKKPLSKETFKVNPVNKCTKSFLYFLIWVNKRQIFFKILAIFTLYILLLYNLLYTFAHLYVHVSSIFNEGINTEKSMLDAVYFSATTFFTIGFGDITPRDYSQLTKIIVIVQAILGHLITTVFWPIVIIFAFNKKSES